MPHRLRLQVQGAPGACACAWSATTKCTNTNPPPVLTQFVGKERDGGEAAGGGWKDGRPVPVVRRAGGEEEDVKKKVEMSEKEERKMPSLREMRGRDAIGLGWGS